MRCRSPVIAVLLVHAGLLAWSAWRHSPTYDEPAHLAAGISHWEMHRFELYRVNPPLVRMVATQPVLAVPYETDWRAFTDAPGLRVEFSVGRQFANVNGERILWLTTLGRLACIPFSLIGAVVCCLWARDLYGRRAGTLALVAWCFFPEVLAHGALCTPDVAAAALGAAACYALWCWLNEPNWPRTILAGLVLGVAELTKFTLVVFYPLWPAIWLAYRWSQRREMTVRRWGGELLMLAVQVALSLNVINLGYGLEKPLTPLGDFEFVSWSLGGEKAEGLSGNRFRDTWLHNLPVPLPENYLLGIDAQRRDLEGGRYLSYLHGEFSKTGWWYYYLYGMAVKVPLGLWLLFLLTAVSRYTGAASSLRWRDDFVLLAPAAVVLALASSQTGLNQHVRYVLPVYPLAVVWMSQLARRHSRALRVTASLALLWCTASSLWIYPHSLSYFNEVAGGPRGGHAHLILSNIDWGQDLLFLRHWLREHPEAKPLHLVYYGDVEPARIAIDFDFPELGPSADGRPAAKLVLKPGWYAISVSFLRGYPWRAWTRSGTPVWLHQDACTELLACEPTATAGYSIYIYRVLDDDGPGPL
jgi:hypothetical protein